MSCKTTHPSTNSNTDAVSVICELVREQLGVSGSVRCIVSRDQEDEVYAKDTAQIVKCLDIQHPAGVCVIQACLGHKELYGCGVKSMLYLTGQLLSQVHALVKQGVPLFHIAELLNEALDYCIEHMEHAAVPVILSTDNSHADHPESNYPDPSLLSTTRQSHPQKDPLPYPGAQSVMPHHEPKQPDVSVKETDMLAPDASGLVGVKDGHGRTNQSGKASLLKSYKPGMVQNPKSFAVRADLPGLNDVLRHRLKPSSTAGMHRNVMLRSRHLQHCGSSDEEKSSKTSEPRDHSSSSVIGQEHLDCLHPVEDASLQQNMKGNSTCVSSTEEHRCSNHRKSVSSSQSSRRPNQGLAAKKTSVSLPKDAQALSHGCCEMMSWAMEAMHRHLLHGKRFDADLLHTVCVVDHEGRNQLLEGLVVSASSDVMEVISKLSGPTSVLLINGDVTAEFKHRGYKALLPSVQFTENVESLHQSSDSWNDKILEQLKQLNIQVVLARGTVNPDLCAACMAAGIALVDRVSFPALKVLQTACQVDFATYILDAHEGNVCRDVSLKPLREDWCDTVYLDHKHLVITPSVFVQTLVIVASSAAGREIREEEFWHGVARLAQAAEDGRVLEGGGGTEELCARLLTTHEDHPDRGSVTQRWVGELALYRPLVRSALAEAFLTFTRTVQQNRQKAGYVTKNVKENLRTAHPTQPSLQTSFCSNLCQDSSCDFSRDPNCQSCHPVTCEKSVRSRDNSCKPPSEKESCCCIPLSDCSTCRKQKFTEAGCSPSRPDSQDFGTKPNFEDLPHASKQQQCCEHRGHSLCVASQEGTTTEDYLRSADSLLRVCQNMATEHGFDERAVWDNYSSKVSGWRCAVQCVCTVMRMDEVITTGVDQQSLPPHSVLL